MEFLRAQKITVSADRIRCRVQFHASCPRFSSSELMQILLEQRPRLSQHACVNKKGPTFAFVMNHTPLIHVLEHLTIDFQVESQPQSAALFVGTSSMVDQDQRIGELEVNFVDDVLTLAALNHAIQLLNQALQQTVPGTQNAAK